MKVLLAAIVVFISSHVNCQCLVQKTGPYYGFFRVTNFKQKLCWLSEPFAYNIKNDEIANYKANQGMFPEEGSRLRGEYC